MTDGATAASVNAIGNKRVFDEGFDLDIAVYNLHAAAIQAGALPERDPQAVSPAFTSMAHDHSNNLCECTKNPCRIQALCFALAEVVRYREESRALAHFIDAADKTADMRTDLQKLVSRYVPVLDWFDQQSIEEHRLERDLGPRLQRHFHEVLCVLPKEIRESLGALQVLFDELEQLEGKLRGIPGLRQGEIIALRWSDVDWVAGALTVRRSSWKGVVGTPKSGRERKVPLTVRLKAALKAHRHLISELVFCHSDGRPFTQSAIEAALRFGCKRAGLRIIGSHVPHLLLASRYAWLGAEGDPGTRRSLDAQHDPSVHASGAECTARSDRASRLWAARGQ